MKEKTLTIIIRIALITSIISGGLLLAYSYSLRKANNEFDDLAMIFEEVKQNENLVKVKKVNKINIDFEELYNRNTDIVAWISIPGTKVDYPVMYTPQDPEYYLYRNYNKEYSASGVPFLDASSSVESQIESQTDNLLIHGHNMKNGTMFAQLLLYKNEEFFKEHSAIEFYTFTGKKIYDIIAVFPTKIYNGKGSHFKYQRFINAKDKEEFDTYVNSIKTVSLYDTGISAEYGDRLMTLSTCSYHTANGRFVVVAKER